MTTRTAYKSHHCTPADPTCPSLFPFCLFVLFFVFCSFVFPSQTRRRSMCLFSIRLPLYAANLNFDRGR